MIYRKMLFIAPDLRIKQLMNYELTGERISELLERNSLFGERRDLLDFTDRSNSRLVTISLTDATHSVKSTLWEGLTLFGDIELNSLSPYYEYIKMSMEEKDIGWFLPRIFVQRDEWKSIELLCLITFDYSRHTFETTDYAERCKNYLSMR